MKKEALVKTGTACAAKCTCDKETKKLAATVAKLQKALDAANLKAAKVASVNAAKIAKANDTIASLKATVADLKAKLKQKK